MALNIALVLGILGYVGVQATSFAAMLGNFAAGAFMLVLKPFRVGNFSGVAGIERLAQRAGADAVTDPDQPRGAGLNVAGGGLLHWKTMRTPPFL